MSRNKRKPYNTFKEPKIRLDAMQLFFTWPKCDVSMQSCLDQTRVALLKHHTQLRKYIICQEDHEDGTPHLHAWLRTSNQMGRVPPDTFDLSGHGPYPMQGHGTYLTQVWEGSVQRYVTKGCEYITDLTENEFKEELEKHGRVDKQKFSWEVICRNLLDGANIEDIVRTYPLVLRELSKLEENVKRYKQLLNKPKHLDKLDFHWYWGPTGSNKSKTITQDHPDAYIKNSEEFWGGYNFQKVVHFADVDSSWGKTLYLFKVWFDYYIFAAKIKHKDSIDIRPELMIVSSQYTIRETYERMFKQFGFAHDEELILAMERRFKVRRFDYEINPDPLNVFPDDYFVDFKSPDLFLPGCDMDITYDKIFD